MQRFFALLLAIFVCGGLHATARPNTFACTGNKVFVETGTQFGHAVQRALDHGFQEVYSIELSPGYFAQCQRRFANDPRVFLVQGDSAEILGEVIGDIDVPITFWLDAHYSGPHTAMGKRMVPLLKELEQIKRHPINTHTILIDDIHQLETGGLKHISLALLIKKLLEINPDYVFSFDDGHIKNDILVAKPPWRRTR